MNHTDNFHQKLDVAKLHCRVTEFKNAPFIPKVAYSQSAQFCPFFEPIFPQNGHNCASFRKKSVFIEKFVKI